MKKVFQSPRRRMVWKKLRSIRGFFAALVGTALGAGLFPVAPGTMGTIVGMPLAYYTTIAWGVPERVFFWCVLTLVGTWLAKVLDELMETGDNQNIVIDEVIGMGVCAWTAGTDWRLWILAFVLFRFFDVLKPFPVREVDSWSKNKSSPWWSGFGVIADDIVAGFQGLAVIVFLQWLLVF